VFRLGRNGFLKRLPRSQCVGHAQFGEACSVELPRLAAPGQRRLDLQRLGGRNGAESERLAELRGGARDEVEELRFSAGRRRWGKQLATRGVVQPDVEAHEAALPWSQSRIRTEHDEIRAEVLLESGPEILGERVGVGNAQLRFGPSHLVARDHT
jgi:hypothetical protein